MTTIAAAGVANLTTSTRYVLSMSIEEQPSASVAPEAENRGILQSICSALFSHQQANDDKNILNTTTVFMNWNSWTEWQRPAVGETIFVSINSPPVTGSEDRYWSFMAKHNPNVQRRVVAIPAHILRWSGLKPGTEVTVGINEDLDVGRARINGQPQANASLSLDSVELSIRLESSLRESSQLSLCADSLAADFRHQFLGQVVNFGQLLLFQFPGKSSRKRRHGDDDSDVENLEQPGLMSWYKKLTSNSNKKQPFARNNLHIIAAKVLRLHLVSVADSYKCYIANYGLIREGTKIMLRLEAESTAGLTLYGDPVILLKDQPSANATVAATAVAAPTTATAATTTNAANAGSANVTAATAASISSVAPAATASVPKPVAGATATNEAPALKLRATTLVSMSIYRSESSRRECLLDSTDYNVATKGSEILITFTPNPDESGEEEGQKTASAVEKGQKNSATAADSTNDKSKQKQQQIIVMARNTSSSGAVCKKGHVVLGNALMERMRVEDEDELLVQPVGKEHRRRLAKRVQVEIHCCTAKMNCPLCYGASTQTMFRDQDIGTSLRKLWLKQFISVSASANFKVIEEDNNKRGSNNRKQYHAGSSSGHTESGCLNYMVTNIVAVNQPEKPSEKQGNNEKEEEEENACFAVGAKNTLVEIKCIDDALTIFGNSGEKSSDAAPIVDQKKWDFEAMGIGGMDKEMGDIFRRAFASRMLSPECRKELEIKHLRGILLYGPPGTGKTLIARQVAKVLNSREPKIHVYLGQTEQNVRSLFADAVKEQQFAGDQSRLHVIIIDELDALCPNRSKMSSESGKTAQRVVNTLLANLDGVEQLNNILLIGMTNLKDTIDPALLRPGRIELQLHIGLPSEQGRLQILQIHTKKMRETNRLNPDVDLEHLAKTCVNFSGAELEGLVRAAQSQAMQRLITLPMPQTATSDANGNTTDGQQELQICSNDFKMALETDVTPAFGGKSSKELLDTILCRKPITWCPEVKKVMEKGTELVEALRQSNASAYGHSRLILFTGPRHCGKTFLAASLAEQNDIPYIRLINAGTFLGIGNNSSAGPNNPPTKVLGQLFADCEHSALSCIIFDGVEEIIEYDEWSGKLNATILQTLNLYLERRPGKEKRLLIVLTSCKPVEWFERIQLMRSCDLALEVPEFGKLGHFMAVIKAATAMGTEQREEGESSLVSITSPALRVSPMFSPEQLEHIGASIAKKIGFGLGPELSIRELTELMDWITSLECEESSAAGESRAQKLCKRITDLLAQKRAQQMQQRSSSGASHLKMYN